MENKKSETASLAITKLIVVFDFRQAKISREFPTREAIKIMLYIVVQLITMGTASIGSIHVRFSSALRETSELLFPSMIIKSKRFYLRNPNEDAVQIITSIS